MIRMVYRVATIRSSHMSTSNIVQDVTTWLPVDCFGDQIMHNQCA